jgi:hypothetical protein
VISSGEKKRAFHARSAPPSSTGQHFCPETADPAGGGLQRGCNFGQAARRATHSQRNQWFESISSSGESVANHGRIGFLPVLSRSPPTVPAINAPASRHEIDALPLTAARNEPLPLRRRGMARGDPERFPALLAAHAQTAELG